MEKPKESKKSKTEKTPVQARVSPNIDRVSPSIGRVSPSIVFGSTINVDAKVKNNITKGEDSKFQLRNKNRTKKASGTTTNTTTTTIPTIISPRRRNNNHELLEVELRNDSLLEGENKEGDFLHELDDYNGDPIYLFLSLYNFLLSLSTFSLSLSL